MPFVQLDSSLAREHSGTGLGLSLVQRLAELHGGGIYVESTPGSGSRFTVALPWEPSKEGDEAVDGHAAENPAVREPASDTPVRRPLATGGDPPLLLVVDDHEANVMLLSSYLSGAGYRVAVARNGLEAIERTSTERPALILMDIQMPGIDGLEATRRIRNLPDVASTPIVALTALAMPDDREKALAAGVDDYVTKPLQLSKLVQLVERHLERTSRPGA
jgi:CheY-like chemotaxis protein